MTRYLADSTDLTAIANAIRTKGGTSSPLVFPAGFEAAISAISASSNITNAAYLFYYGNRLDQLADIMNLVKDPTTAAYMFNYAFSTTNTTFEIPMMDCKYVTSLRGFLQYCTRLTAVSGLANLKNIGSTLTQLAYFFDNCSNLAGSVVIPASWDTSGVTTIDNMFNKCSALTSIDLSNMDLSACKNMQMLFSECTRVTTITLPSTFRSDIATFYYFFNKCTYLTTVNLSALGSVSTKDFTNMFYMCVNLPEADLSNLVYTGNQTLTLTNMFYGCSSLQKIAITFGGFASASSMFYGCSALTELVLLNTTSVLGINNSNAFTSSGIASGNCTIYVPDALVDTYKTATNWSTYASQIKGLSEHPNPWWASAQ